MSGTWHSLPILGRVSTLLWVRGDFKVLATGFICLYRFSSCLVHLQRRIAHSYGVPPVQPYITRAQLKSTTAHTYAAVHQLNELQDDIWASLALIRRCHRNQILMKSEFHLPRAEQLVEIRIISPNVFRIESSGLTVYLTQCIWWWPTQERIFTERRPFDARLQAALVRLCVSRALRRMKLCLDYGGVIYYSPECVVMSRTTRWHCYTVNVPQ